MTGINGKIFVSLVTNWGEGVKTIVGQIKPLWAIYTGCLKKCIHTKMYFSKHCLHNVCAYFLWANSFCCMRGFWMSTSVEIIIFFHFWIDISFCRLVPFFVSLRMFVYSKIMKMLSTVLGTFWCYLSHLDL